MESVYLFQVFTLTGFKKGDILTLDFSISGITTRPGTLSTCYQLKTDSSKIQLTNCVCDSSKCNIELV